MLFNDAIHFQFIQITLICEYYMMFIDVYLSSGNIKKKIHQTIGTIFVKTEFELIENTTNGIKKSFLFF